MQRMEVIIRYIDDGDQVLSESNMSFQMLDVDSIPREERLDQLESDTLDKGHEIMRLMFLSQCQLVDQQLAEKRKHSNPDCIVQLDGNDPLKIASRLGILQLPRQVCYCETCNQHFIPMNDWLPEHGGMITTRGLQEWACLLPQELPFSTAGRLLGWVAKEPAVLSQTQLRTLVREHGGEIRQAEASEVSEFQLVRTCPRRHPSWCHWIHQDVIPHGQESFMMQWNRHWLKSLSLRQKASPRMIGTEWLPTRSKLKMKKTKWKYPIWLVLVQRWMTIRW
jgi:hypothetical protein